MTMAESDVEEAGVKLEDYEVWRNAAESAAKELKVFQRQAEAGELRTEKDAQAIISIVFDPITLVEPGRSNPRNAIREEVANVRELMMLLFAYADAWPESFELAKTLQSMVRSKHLISR